MMIHLRYFVVGYWKALAGATAWLLSILLSNLIPDTFIYPYGTIWAGMVVAVTAFFVLGYIRYSKPSKDPVTHKRSWSGVWAWILSQSAIILLVFGYIVFFRLVNEQPELNADRVQQYRVGSWIFITVFFVQLWITWIWTVLHEDQARQAWKPDR